jgi:hypothetical protein
MDSQVLFAFFFFSLLPSFYQGCTLPLKCFSFIFVYFIFIFYFLFIFISDILTRYFFGIIVVHHMLPMQLYDARAQYPL